MTQLVSIRFDANKAIAKLNIESRKRQALFRRSIGRTMQAIGVEIKRRAANDITSAGNFSSRWPQALQVVPNTVGDSSALDIGFDDTIPYGHIHEFGGTIRGRPLLWIPLSFGDAPKSGQGSGKVSARDYPGQLFRVERQGKNPLLFSNTGAQYVGVTSVTLRPRFHIRSITANVVRTQLARLFAKFVKGS